MINSQRGTGDILCGIATTSLLSISMLSGCAGVPKNILGDSKYCQESVADYEAYNSCIQAIEALEIGSPEIMSSTATLVEFLKHRWPSEKLPAKAAIALGRLNVKGAVVEELLTNRLLNENEGFEVRVSCAKAIRTINPGLAPGLSKTVREQFSAAGEAMPGVYLRGPGKQDVSLVLADVLDGKDYCFGGMGEAYSTPNENCRRQ